MKPRPFPELQGILTEQHAESGPEGAGGSGMGTEQGQGQGALPTLGRPSTLRCQNRTAVSQKPTRSCSYSAKIQTWVIFFF